jgi:hypothetical protein
MAHRSARGTLRRWQGGCFLGARYSVGAVSHERGAPVGARGARLGSYSCVSPDSGLLGPVSKVMQKEKRKKTIINPYAAQNRVPKKKKSNRNTPANLSTPKRSARGALRRWRAFHLERSFFKTDMDATSFSRIESRIPCLQPCNLPEQFLGLTSFSLPPFMSC